MMRDPQGLRALEQELPVAPHPLGVHRLDMQHLLSLRVLGCELRDPLDPVLLAPAVEHVVGSTEARAGVDDRGSAHRTADRCGNRGKPLGDCQAAVAVKRGERGEGLVGIGGPVHVGAGLQDEDVMPGLGEDGRGDRAAGARTNDREVAVLAITYGTQVAQRLGGRSRGLRRACRQLAPCGRAHRGADSLVVRVAAAHEDLEQKQ
jgi:hypothetical protein